MQGGHKGFKVKRVDNNFCHLEDIVMLCDIVVDYMALDFHGKLVKFS